jgi:acetyltransferase-like isoleucine patch superfamily enzyme
VTEDSPGPISPGPDLARIYELEDRRSREQWQRSLPVVEVATDRWQRATSLGFGAGTSIYHLSYDYGDESVGENTWIGPYTLLDGSGGLRIGSYCSISAGVHIYSHNTVKWAISAGNTPYEREATAIGDCCFLGPHTVVAMGVTIAPHCVVGAHSFVNRDVPEYSIVAGAPARVVGMITMSADGTPEFHYDRPDSGA